MAVGTGSYILWRNRQGIGRDLGINNLFNPLNINLQDGESITVGGGDGLLTINGDELINGNLTVTGDANIQGTLTAGAFIGDGSGLTNIQSTGSEPFTAFTNRNNQLFFGNNQLFRNAANSNGAFQIQSANANPLFNANTANNSIGINNANPTFTLDVVGNGKFTSNLEVGNAAVNNDTILTSLFFGTQINKTLAVGTVSTTNAAATVYVTQGNELLINPTTDAFANGNFYAASYSAAQTEASNPSNYFLIGGNLSNVTHAGSGTVGFATGQLGIASNIGSGNMALVSGSANLITVGGSGDISIAAGTATLNPFFSSPSITGTIDQSYGFLVGNALGPVGTTNDPRIGMQVGLAIFEQNAAGCVDPLSLGTLCPGVVTPVNVNLLSQGRNTALSAGSFNEFQGDLVVGTPNDAADAVLYNAMKTVGNPTRLVVRTDASGATGTYDALATVQFNSNGGTSKALVVQNTLGGTGDLTQWQSSTGSVLARITSSGAVGIGASPTNRFDVTDTSDDTPASFTGTSGTCTVDTLGGGWSCVSDERLKTNIVGIEGGWEKLLELQGVMYNWKSDPNATAQVSGFVAQEVQKVLPGLVSELDDGTLSLNKDGMIPYLVEAVKAENGKIESINGRLSEQGLRLDDLSAEFQALATQIQDHEDRIQILEAKRATDAARIDELEKKLNQAPSSQTPTP
jgi:hypothetical protein